MEDITFDDIKELFKETDKKFKQTDKKFDKYVEESRIQMQEMRKELGGIGNTQGKVTEDFFYSALENLMEVNNLKFDYIDRNTKRKRKNTVAEYDIILYNKYKVMIIEVKYVFRKRNLKQLKENISKFKTLYPEYKDYKKYGAIAAMTFEDDVINEAKDYGFLILTQNNKEIKILNEKNFEAKEYK